MFAQSFQLIMIDFFFLHKSGLNSLLKYTINVMSLSVKSNKVFLMVIYSIQIEHDSTMHTLSYLYRYFDTRQRFIFISIDLVMFVLCRLAPS